MENQLKRSNLINRKKLTIAEHSQAGSDGRCSFLNAFHSNDLEKKNEAAHAYAFHKLRRSEYPYSDVWVNHFEHTFKNVRNF